MKNSFPRWLLTVVSVCVFGVNVFALGQDTDVVELKPGLPTIRNLSGSEQHLYRVVLQRGQYVAVVARQKSIDIAMKLLGPTGQSLVAVDNAGGAESVLMVADTDGTYRVEVTASDKEAKLGQYEIQIAELREATESDRLAVTAQKLAEEASQLANKRTAESRREAIKKYESALPLWRESKRIGGQAAALNDIAIIYSNLGEGRKAVEYYQQAVPLWHEYGDSVNEAATLTNMGTALWRLGELQQAIEAHNRALPLAKAAGDRQIEALVVGNTGTVYWSMGRPRDALKYFTDALLISQALGDRRRQAVNLNNIGTAHQQLGDLQSALDALRQVVTLREALGDRTGQASPLNNLGLLYLQLGDLETSEKSYLQSLEIRRASGDRQNEATVLQGLSILYVRKGDLSAALKSAEQSLTLARAVGDRSLEAYVLVVIGKVNERQGEVKKALENFTQALEIRRAVGDRYGESYALSSMGNAYLALDDQVKAGEYYEQALKLTREIGDKLGETEILYGLARKHRKAGDKQSARNTVEAALAIIESTRKNVASTDFRSSFFASYQSHYDFLIGLLMEMGQADAALEISERARARALLDSLNETYAHIKEGVDVATLERERSVRHQLSQESDRLTRLLSGKYTEQQAEVLRKKVEDLLSEHRDLQTQLRVKSPRYNALTQPQPQSTKDIQKLLDPDTVLLEYALGEEKSFLWAVTPTGVKSFVLPARATIEAAVERFNQTITDNQNRNLNLQVEAGAALSNLVLQPVAKELGQKKLVVVRDGALLRVPFSALPLPNSSRRYRPLILEHEIVQLPSASVLAELRRDTVSRTIPEKMVAVFADPVFQPVDPRVTGSGGTKTDSKRSGWESGIENLRRLPFSRREADAIVDLVARDQSFKAVDFAANRTTVATEPLSRYRVVHFATHALLNNQHPELSGVVLSLVDETGEPRDGFLRLYDIYNLRLSADLVVLSACRTALGKQIRGEGLVGLTRGFMYAGARRVVVSLWEVNDEATAELMQRFYTAMFSKGMRPAAALRSAQLSMARHRWWNAPYYWAAFELQGEVR